MSKRGRPPVLDEKKRGQIVGAITLGGSIATAARTVGCCPRTIYNTARRDSAFRDEIQQAPLASASGVSFCAANSTKSHTPGSVTD